jgi:uncharacterized membrane protein
MYPPVTNGTLGIFAVVLIALFALIEVGAIEAAYERLGMSHRTASAILLAMIAGSYINIPLATVPAHKIVHDQIVHYWGMNYVVPSVVYTNRTEIAINAGGALIPVLICAYLLMRWRMWLKSAIAVAMVTPIVYSLSSVVPGVGIAVPTLIPGVLAAVIAWLLDRRRAPVIAYVAGTLGCLLGADILNLPIIYELRAPVASIGGAGTFDGVFVSGLIAVLLA